MSTKRGHLRSRQTWLALGISPLVLAPIAAHAQQQQATEEIVVTGSRIARPNLTQPNPVSVVSGEQIRITGATSVIEVANELPQTQNNSTPENNARYVNGAGLQHINLRGLGTYRTLTLVDGRRHIGSLSGVNNSGGTGNVDVSTIPPLLIDRIDIVTGGSSAVYGADAVAGVVNFIMKKNYEGAEFDAQIGGAQHGGHYTQNLDGIVGVNFGGDRGNVTMAFDYARQTGIYADQRDYATCAQNWTTGTTTDFKQIGCTVSSRVAASGAPTVATPIGRNPGYTFALKPDGSGLIPFNRGTLVPGNTGLSIGGDGQNTTANTLPLQTPNIRYVADMVGRYRVAEDLGPLKTVNVFADVKYANSHGAFDNGTHVNGTIGPTARSALNVPITSPFIPGDLRALLTTNGLNAVQLTRSNDDWSKRGSNYNYDVLRTVVGIDGLFSNGWKYDVSYNYGRNKVTFLNTDRITANINDQLDAVISPTTGAVVCRSTLTVPTNGCVPINPFKVGGLTSQQFNYSYILTHEDDLLQEHDAQANVTGDLFKFATPFSGTVAPLSFAAGVEWRMEKTNSQPDPLQIRPADTLFGNNTGTRGTVGSYTTREFYVETAVPVLRDLPFAKAVDIDGAIRAQDYSSTGRDYTWNLMATWAVNDDIKFRGGFAKSVRAPNGDELFSSGGQSFISITDPCSVQFINQSATRLRNCRAAGVPVGFDATTVAPAASNITGNPGLDSETGRSVTVGAVFTPSFLPRFTATVDYYQVRVKHAVVIPDATSIANGCYDVGTNCSFVSRRPDGSLDSIQTPYVNAGFEKLQGMDFDLNYIVELGALGLKNGSTLSLNTNWNWTPRHTLMPFIEDPTQTQYLAGTLGYPRVQGLVRAIYDIDDFSFAWTSRYRGATSLYNTLPGQPTYDPNTVPSQWFHDVYAAYTWRKVQIFGGITNIADEKPPQIPGVFNGGNFPAGLGNPVNTTQQNASFSVTGRAFFGGVRVKF
ncbi:TonB-dependent receptor plug domain-containing protein [Roseiterribacter gracilis]|uniref:TonB-dependent receptor n=1 Tax=Roseiterribacter gracilis TaxID=2812848 RepID=A0A8S8X7M4_9PROT|nr:TonB-dependent receptor [Rhodospirillales bacterium TMPK1]